MSECRSAHDDIHATNTVLIPSCLRPTDISQLAAYDAIKSSLLAIPALLLKDDVKTHLLSGVLAGTIATTAAAPFDVLKSRIQSSVGETVSLPSPA